MNKEWKKAQEWEKLWWNSCSNTVWEDVKQMTLAPYLGLKIVPNAYTNYRIPLEGQSVLDIGGGPSSLLLKCENVKGTVVDPCDYPKWVAERYKGSGIKYLKMKGEDIKEGEYDITLIYNCLQHTDSPDKIIKNALRVSSEVRVFEWINTSINEGHLHSFTKEYFDEKLGGEGKTVTLNSSGLYGEAYYGIFKGRTFKEDRF